jgi:hypothetical protein
LLHLAARKLICACGPHKMLLPMDLSQICSVSKPNIAAVFNQHHHPVYFYLAAFRTLTVIHGYAA